MPWQPGISNPFRGIIVWPEPDPVDITVTLYKVMLLNQYTVPLKHNIHVFKRNNLYNMPNLHVHYAYNKVCTIVQNTHNISSLLEIP